MLKYIYIYIYIYVYIYICIYIYIYTHICFLSVSENWDPHLYIMIVMPIKGGGLSIMGRI